MVPTLLIFGQWALNLRAHSGSIVIRARANFEWGDMKSNVRPVATARRAYCALLDHSLHDWAIIPLAERSTKSGLIQNMGQRTHNYALILILIPSSTLFMLR